MLHNLQVFESINIGSLFWHDFAEYSYKSSKMRKQTPKSIVVINANQFKDGRKNMPVKKNPRYIYTEADLGEGILDVGIPSYYKTDQQDNIHTKPWASMLKTGWS